MNYAIHARGTPGSIFKMVTGIGGAGGGRAAAHGDESATMGYFTLYNKDEVHGAQVLDQRQNALYRSTRNQTIVEGLTHSCNYFFYTIGEPPGRGTAVSLCVAAGI